MKEPKPFEQQDRNSSDIMELQDECRDLRRQVRLLIEVTTGLLQRESHGESEGVKTLGRQSGKIAANGANNVGSGNC